MLETSDQRTDVVRDSESLLEQPPTSIPELRQFRKVRVAAALRLFALRGLANGIAGHITARDPEFPDHFWVNPVFKNFASMRAQDLLLVDHDGTVLEGDGHLNLAAFAIHSRIHGVRPDVVSAAHAHSTYGQIWATTGRLLDPLTQDSCAFFEDHAVYERFNGVVLELDEADEIAEILGSRKAAILQNHGLLTVGSTVEEAAWWFVAMNQACLVQIHAEAIGAPLMIDPATARTTRATVGTAFSGRLQFEYECQFLDWEDISA